MKLHGSEGTIQFTAPARALFNLFHVPSFEAAIAIIRRFPHCILEEVRDARKGATNSIVAIKVTYQNWHKYQADYSTERSRIWRAKRRHHATHQEEKRRDVEEKRKEEIPQTPLAAPVSTSKANDTAAPKGAGLKPGSNPLSTLKINGKPYVPEPEIPEEERMSPEDMATIRQQNFAHAAARQPPAEGAQDDVF
jgi:hypothetical protein